MNKYILLFPCVFAAISMGRRKSDNKVSECRDKDEVCNDWSLNGGCKKNPLYMEERCRKACNWCDKKKRDELCRDTLKYCKSCVMWEFKGECKRNPSFMWKNCKKSCKWCNLKVEGASNSCKGGIETYPSSLPNSNFYKKICYSKRGIKIVASPRVSDAAMHRAAFIIDHVLQKVDPAVIKSLNYYKLRHAIMAAYPKELTSDIPEHRFMKPHKYWNERARGLGATIAVPLSSSAEENIMCHYDDRYLGQDITIHEFTHGLQLLGFAPTFPNFDKQLASLFKTIKKSPKNPWAGKYDYAMTNKLEYFGEAMQSYFDAHTRYEGKANTKQQLKKNDLRMYKFIKKYLGGVSWKRTCFSDS